MHMTLLRAIRWVTWGVFGIAGALLLAVSSGWLVTDGPLSRIGSTSSSAGPSLGGRFEMSDQQGRKFTDADLRGKPAMLFFGFTSCPDICPTTLAEIGAWLDALGPAGSDIRAVFVSVDPERDSVSNIAAYLEMFDSRIIGLTGTPEQLAEIAKAYRIYYRKVPMEGGGYTMDHTAGIYLLDRELRYASLLDAHMEQEVALEKIRQVLR